MSSRTWLIIFLFLFSITIHNAQEVKISKVLDSNLFELEDGRKIKLAGVDSPNLNNPSPYLHTIAKNAITFADKSLRRIKLHLEPVTTMDSVHFVILKRNYALGDISINNSYLTFGFGKFIDNVSDSFKNEMLEKQKKAIADDEGIWKYYTPTANDTLDRDLTTNYGINYFAPDFTKITEKFKARPIYFEIPLELVAGSGMTLLTTLGTGLIMSTIIRTSGGWGSGYALAYGSFWLGYIFGFPTGVHFVAKNDNPNLSWWATVGFSVGMTFVSGAVSGWIEPKDQNHFTRNFIYLSPIIGSLLYTHVFPPLPPSREELIQQYFGTDKISNFKDYYNSTITFKLNILRIHF